VKAPRRQTIALQEHAAWIVRDNLLLLEQQKGKRAGGLWKLPLLESPQPGAPVLYETVYPFTHHKITLTVRESAAPARQTETQRWFPLETVLSDAPLTAGHRRAITALAAEQSKKAS
jgi:hypothetical protein